MQAKRNSILVRMSITSSYRKSTYTNFYFRWLTQLENNSLDRETLNSDIVLH